jgi:hypothetical protein
MTARKGLQREGADEKIPGCFLEANHGLKDIIQNSRCNYTKTLSTICYSRQRYYHPINIILE